MAEKKKPSPPGIPTVFKDVLRSLGFGAVVDRKKDLKKQEKKAGA